MHLVLCMNLEFFMETFGAVISWSYREVFVSLILGFLYSITRSEDCKRECAKLEYIWKHICGCHWHLSKVERID